MTLRNKKLIPPGRSGPAILGCLLLAFVLAAGGATQARNNGSPTPEVDDWSHLRTGAEIYEAACASCHGRDGKGVPPAVLGFETPVPDFTDCSFASREPHGDWFAITHNGGPTRGFDRMMPAFGGAVTDEQLDLAASHVKDFCTDKSWPDGDFNIPRALVTGKAFPEDEFVWELSGSTKKGTVEDGEARNPQSYKLVFVAEKRLGKRNQLELIVPMGVQQAVDVDENGEESLRWGEGFGDLGLAWKGVLWHSLRGGTIGSLGAEVFFPLGDEEDQFSKGIFRFEPFLAVGQLIPGNNFFQLHGGAELSTDLDVAKHEVFWRAALGHTFTQGRFGRAWSPMVEGIGKLELEDGAAVEWSVVPALHIALNTRQHVMLVLGAEIPVNEFDERQITAMVHLLWDWFDGGFTEGW
jgi:mono/diheme cytochrome c family protein